MVCKKEPWQKELTKWWRRYAKGLTTSCGIKMPPGMVVINAFQYAFNLGYKQGYKKAQDEEMENSR